MSGPDEMGPSPSIWAALPVPAFVTINREGRETILDCNPAAELFLSASAGQLRGDPVHDRLMMDAPVVAALARARTNKATIFVNDADLRTAGRAPLVCNLQIAPLNNTADTLLLLVAPRDIAGRLGRARAVQGVAKAAIGMAEMLAHEIRNPLAGIAGAAQLLAMGLDSADRELTDLIVTETRRVVKLLDQVEQFGDQRPPERRATNIHDVVERARRSAAVGFGTHMRIESDYDPSLPEAFVDPDQVLQVFLNLLKNACEAQEAHGTIRIRTYFERGLRVHGTDGQRIALPLHVEITDDGPGLPPALAENVFEPFVSGRENGTGLGLALVSKIVAAHGGWIEATSRPGQTTFRLSLPMVPAVRANHPPPVRDRDAKTREPC